MSDSSQLSSETPGTPRRRRQLKTSEVIAREIALDIIDRELPVGSMLPPEVDMRESYGVGRSTLREALLLLETRGVITVKSGPGGGPVIRRPRPSDLSEALTLILHFEGGSLRDVLEARTALEPMLTRLAASRMTDEQLDELQVTIDEMLANLDSQETFVEKNERFHALIASYSGNVVLGAFAATLGSIADGIRVGVRYEPARRQAVAAAHQRIVNAIRARDATAAAAAMEDHIDEAGRFWKRNYPDLVDRPVRWTQ
jgi:GntR family transcriptional regulator, transcriptional repressor for pyruvate dehydrogenase complex